VHSTIINALLWLGYPLELFTLAFLIYRRSFRILQFFSLYLALLLVWDSAWFIISNQPAMYNSLWAYHLFWTMEVIFSALRVLAIGEICWRSLRAYPAIWHLVSRTLIAIAAVLLTWTAISAYASRGAIQKFVDIGLQRFEFMQAVVALAFIAMAYRYRVRLLPIHRLTLLGLCLYSTIQVANNQINALNPRHLLPIFDIVRRLSISLSQCIWLYAAAQPLREPAKSESEIFSGGELERFAPEVHDRLRELNDRLGELLHV
jgi:hypothetical protein